VFHNALKMKNSWMVDASAFMDTTKLMVIASHVQKKHITTTKHFSVHLYVG